MKSISLVLFVDGAAFHKTGAKGSKWAMFSCLLDLPPRLRMCFNNIVTHFIVGASNFDLNEPALAKATNMIQYNGSF